MKRKLKPLEKLDIPDDLTLAEAARMSLLEAHNIHKARSSLRPFLRWLKLHYSEYVRPISEQPYLLKEYYPFCLGNWKNGGATVKQRAAKKFIDWLEKQGWSRGVVVPKAHTPSRLPRCVPTDKIKAAIEEADEPLANILRFMVETGCRPSEARRLCWGHIIFPHELPKNNGIGLVKFVDKKWFAQTQKVAGKIRRFPIPPSIVLMLELLKVKALNTDPDSRVFRTCSGIGWGSRNLDKCVAELKAGVTSYDFRHAHAQLSMDAGEADDIIARRMGHCDTSTLKNYAEVRDQRVLSEAADRKELL